MSTPSWESTFARATSHIPNDISQASSSQQQAHSAMQLSDDRTGISSRQQQGPMHVFDSSTGRHGSRQHLQQEHDHHQQQQQQQNQQRLAEQWQPGLSTYQALQQLHTSARPPEFLFSASPLLARQNSEPALGALDTTERLYVQQEGEAKLQTPGSASSSSWQAAPLQLHLRHREANLQAPALGRDAQLQQADVQPPLQATSDVQTGPPRPGLLSRLLKGRRRARVHHARQADSRQ